MAACTWRRYALAMRGACTAFTLSGAALVACGGDVVRGGSGGADVGGASTGPSAGAGGWETLIEGDWDLAPASEGYFCVVKTMPQTMHVRALRPIAPLGTHHTVLGRVDAPFPDGVFPCDVTTQGPDMIYGSGVGTTAIELPAGVAVTIPAGQRLVLNLHLFNTSASLLSGSSGVQVQRMAAADVVHEAQSLLAGPMSLDIQPNSETIAGGQCTLPGGTTIVAVMPHMHRLGTHMRVALTQGAAETVIHDAPYSFEDQRHYLLPTPLTTVPGDAVTVTCTYQNDTTDVVHWGDSTLDEMCFGGLLFYPAAGLALICSD